MTMTQWIIAQSTGSSQTIRALWRDSGIVLDVGTGTAQIPIELCRRAPSLRVVAIDLAEHMLRVGHENVCRADLLERIQLQRVDAKCLPYAAETFAAVVSNSIVHHIAEPAVIFSEM